MKPKFSLIILLALLFTGGFAAPSFAKDKGRHHKHDRYEYRHRYYRNYHGHHYYRHYPRYYAPRYYAPYYGYYGPYYRPGVTLHLGL